MDYFSQKTAPGLELRLVQVKKLASEKSAFQTIEIFENPTLGTVLAIDGVLQLSEKDQGDYHNALVLPAARMCGSLERALILGGGDGGAAAVCSSLGFQSIDMVEIDARVIELCQQHFPMIWKNIDRKRLNLHIDDASKFICGDSSKYDLIICDFTDYAPNSPSEHLYGFSFYNNIKGRLKTSGVVSTQAGAPLVYPRSTMRITDNLRKVFRFAGSFSFPLLTFGTGSAAISVAWSDSNCLEQAFTNSYPSKCFAQLSALRSQCSDIHVSGEL